MRRVSLLALALAIRVVSVAPSIPPALSMTMNSMPLVGLGTFQLKGDVAKQAVFQALKEGYRLVDTATIYRNEESVGDGLILAEKELGICREEIFLTSKISPSEQGYDATIKASQESLLRLKTSYHDLLLVHWPGVSKTPVDSKENREKRRESWRALEDLKDKGTARRIGVSNFCEGHLVDLLAVCRTPPFLNQIEVHPLCYPRELIALCRSRHVAVQAYSSLGSPQGFPVLSQHPAVSSMAREIGVSEAKLLLAWGLRVTDGVLIRSTSADHRKDALSAVCLAQSLTYGQVARLAEASGGKARKFCWDPSGVA